MSLLSWCHLLLRNWPCSSPRGRRSSPPIFGPAFSWSSKEEEQQVCLLPAERPRSWAGLVIQIFYLHHAVTRPLKQAAVPETEKHCLPGRINLNVLLLLNRERERERTEVSASLRAVLVRQPVECDGPLAAGTLEETLDGVVPAQLMVLLHAAVGRFEVGVVTLGAQNKPRRFIPTLVPIQSLTISRLYLLLYVVPRIFLFLLHYYSLFALHWCSFILFFSTFTPKLPCTLSIYLLKHIYFSILFIAGCVMILFKFLFY